jgi:hypothetical protein
MSARLAACLVRDGILPEATVRAAVARQIVYGGALDTALLEMGAMEEGPLWSELSAATGLPVPDQTWVERADPQLADIFHAGQAARCRAVPVGRRENRLLLLCGDPVEDRALHEASAELSLHLELYVVPEVRLKVARQAVYGEVLPPRFLRLLARLLGAGPVRRWVETLTRAATPVEVSSEGGAGAAAAAPPDPKALRAQVAHPSPGKAVEAMGALAAMRDGGAIPVLVEALRSGDRSVLTAAHQALVQIARQDLGTSRRRWAAWWDKNKDRERVEWLFEGLGHKETRIRLACEEELRQLTGESFGYRFDLPRRERDEARQRWIAGWRQSRESRPGGSG